MGTAFFSVAKRLRRPLQTALQSRLTCLPSIRPHSSRNEAARSTLHSALLPFGRPSANLVPKIESWIDKGNSVHPVDLQINIRNLRKLKRFKQALEVSEWMQNNTNIPFKPGDHAVQLGLIRIVRGLSSAEEYFNKLLEKDKTGQTYGALLNCYVRERIIDKAMIHMKKIKQLGLAFSPSPYNKIMCLYAAVGQLEKVPSVLVEMKEDGVFPNKFSYGMCIRSYGVRSDIYNMEKILKEMEQQPQIVMDWNTYTVVANIYVKSGFSDKAVLALKKAEEQMDKGNAVAYNHIIPLYGLLGDKSAIWRLWKLQKKNSIKLVKQDYKRMFFSLVKIGELEEAEILLKEWGFGQNGLDIRVPNLFFVAYQSNGLIEKAEALLGEFLKKGKKPSSFCWEKVAAGYAQKGEMEKAHVMMKNALRVCKPNAGWTPNNEVVRSILCYLGEKGDLKEVETFIQLLKVFRPMNSYMYYALIRARTRAGKEFDDLLKGMQHDGMEMSKYIKEIMTFAIKENKYIKELNFLERRNVCNDILSVMVRGLSN